MTEIRKITSHEELTRYFGEALSGFIGTPISQATKEEMRQALLDAQKSLVASGRVVPSMSAMVIDRYDVNEFGLVVKVDSLGGEQVVPGFEKPWWSLKRKLNWCRKKNDSMRGHTANLEVEVQLLAPVEYVQVQAVLHPIV